MELGQFIHEQRCILRRQEAACRVARSCAHEINNILQSLTVNLYFAREGTPPESQASHDLAEADKASNALQSFSHHLRLVGRPAEVLPKAVDLRDVINAAVHGWQATTKLAVEVASPPALLPRVWADPTALREAIEALFANAARFCGRPDPGLRVGTDLVGTPVELAWALPALRGAVFVRAWIANVGQPFTSEARLRGWDPYYSTMENQRSAGQGLSMVWRVVTALGGFAHVHAVDSGARVSLFLPVADGAPSPAVAVRGLGEVLAAEG